MRKGITVITVISIIALVALAGTLYAWMIPSSLGPRQQSSGELFPGEKAVYAQARQEGALIVYTVWDTSDITTILQQFSRRYPEIKSASWAASNPELIARVLSEHQAGLHSVDTILSNSAPPILSSAGAVAPYETVQKDSLLLSNPTMPVVGLQVQVLAYNAKLLKPADIPNGWEDAANQKYKGVVALDDPMRGGPLSLVLVGLHDSWRNDTRWSEFIRGLRSLNATVFKSTSALMRLLVAGEYALAVPALLHDVVAEQKKGSPIEFVRTAPPVIFPMFAAVYAMAPHPNSAKLFAEWLISPEGQSVIDSVGRETVRKGFPSQISVESMFPQTVPKIPIINRDYLSDPLAWLNKYVKPLWQGSRNSAEVYSSPTLLADTPYASS